MGAFRDAVYLAVDTWEVGNGGTVNGRPGRVRSNLGKVTYTVPKSIIHLRGFGTNHAM